MSYTVELQEERRALLVTGYADFNFLVEGDAVAAEMLALLEGAQKPVFFINDVRLAPFTYEELIDATNKAARGENPLFKHPKILGVISVTTDEIVQLAAKNMDSEAFNKTKVHVASSLEDAYAIIRRYTHH